MGLKSYLNKLFKGGESTGMDECMKVLEVLDSVLDEEASEQDQKLLTSHIEKCMPCYEHYNLDKSIKELLKARCSKTELPAGLVDSIKLQVSQASDPS